MPAHLPARLAIAFWIWNWATHSQEGEPLGENQADWLLNVNRKITGKCPRKRPTSNVQHRTSNEYTNRPPPFHLDVER